MKNNTQAGLNMGRMGLKMFMKGIVKIFLWSIKNSGEILNKLKSKGFVASCLRFSY